MSTNPTPLTPKTKSKFSSIIVMISIAGFLGLFAACGVWQYLSQTQKKVKELTVTRSVVVAKKEIKAGTKLTEADLAIKQLPAQAIPKDYPGSIDKVKDRIVKTTLQPEEIVIESRLVGQGAAGGLPIVIPAGQRAITIKVNDVIGVGGFISPGDRVDIISITNQSEEKTFSKTILQNVLILAVGDKVLDPNTVSEAGPKIVSQITVAINPKDSEKLALAQATGQLQLVLRPIGEITVSSTEGVSLHDVYGYLPIPTSQSPQAVQGQPITTVSTELPKNSIEIILGDQRSYYYY